MPETTKPPVAPPPVSQPRRPAAPGAHLWRSILPFAVLVMLWAWQRVDTGATEGVEIAYTELYALVAADKVDRLTLTGMEARGQLKAPESLEGKTTQKFRATLPAPPDA